VDSTNIAQLIEDKEAHENSIVSAGKLYAYFYEKFHKHEIRRLKYQIDNYYNNQSKLEQVKTDLYELKDEMNTFLKNDLGIDMSDFTKQMEEMTKKMGEPIVDENDKLD
jgi:uncharacterized protein (DUF608 family)